LAESHLAVHTWPEKHVAWIEIASCIEDKYRKFLLEIEKSALEEVRHIKEVVSMP
jgi:S-adenosylmethionine/arginine decarboxylase-like enzyme